MNHDNMDVMTGLDQSSGPVQVLINEAIIDGSDAFCSIVKQEVDSDIETGVIEEGSILVDGESVLESVPLPAQCDSPATAQCDSPSTAQCDSPATAQCDSPATAQCDSPATALVTERDTSHLHEGQLTIDRSSDSADNKQFIIVTPNGAATVGTGELELLQPEEGADPSIKRYRMQGDDGQTYILSVTDGVTSSFHPTKEHQYQTKRPLPDVLSKEEGVESKLQKVDDGAKKTQLLSNDVSQAWFTTRQDKNLLHSSGAQWRQGQWTKDEVDILQENINKYCLDHGIGDPTEIIFEMSKDDRKQFYRTVARGLQRPLFSVYRRVTRMYDQKNHMGKYSYEETLKLRELRTKHGSDWAAIGQALGRSGSSVKDKCRLMKDTCNSGKWLPEEEKRLTRAVYELSGCRPGEDIVHGLSWASIAERVATRSEKQCRAKWLNYMNWKMKGGKEWTRMDDINLIVRVSNLGVEDDTKIDWDTLAKDWKSARSPQWLRGKWWSLKRHIPDYQLIPFDELLNNMKQFYLQTVRVRNTVGTARTRKLDTSDETFEYTLQAMPQGMEAGELGDLDPSVQQAFEMLQQTSGSYIITTEPDTMQTQAHSLPEQIIVQTVPVIQTVEGDDGVQSRLVIRVPASDLPDGVTLGTADLATTIQLQASDQDLVSLTEGSVIHQSDALTDDAAFTVHSLGESVIASQSEESIGLKQEIYVQTTNGQLMTSFADPMLNSDSNSLMRTGMETEKSTPDDLIVKVD